MAKKKEHRRKKPVFIKYSLQNVFGCGIPALVFYPQVLYMWSLKILTKLLLLLTISVASSSGIVGRAAWGFFAYQQKQP